MKREHIFVVIPSEIGCTLKIVGFTLVISLATAALRDCKNVEAKRSSA